MRRALTVLIGFAMVAGGFAVRGTLPPPFWHTEEDLARRGDVDDLVALAEDDPYHLRFDEEFEETPALTCPTDLQLSCADLYWGFTLTLQPAWDTAAAIDGGRGDLDVWLGPDALVREIAEEDPDSWVVTERLVWTQVVGLAARGSAPLETCERSSTPLTCMAEEATILTMPDPATDVMGAAVVVAVAREHDPELGPEALADAVAVLRKARLSARPADQLLDLGAPPGEVALDGDAPLWERDREELLPQVGARWPRVPTSVGVAGLIDAADPNAERIRLIMDEGGMDYDLEQDGMIGREHFPYVDPDDDRDPRQLWPEHPTDATAEELRAARDAWVGPR